MIELPEYAQVIRNLSVGTHPYLSLLPRIAESPVTRRIVSPATPLSSLLKSAIVRIDPGDGYIFVDVKTPAIVLSEQYYRHGNTIDLYLDLAHELTHLRQFVEGHDLWDHSLRYIERPTEIEGYAVAVEEGLRLGMTEKEINRHLSNPWMTRSDVRQLRENIERFLLKK
jgi:hypothetical protein